MRDRWLEGLLLLTVTAPSLAIAWGRGESGHIAFVLYREPKLIVLSILGWLFLAAFALGPPPGFFMLWRSRRPALLALLAFVGYLALTGLWVRVPQNYFYELNQYVLLVALLWALLVWTRSQPEVADLVRLGMVASLAIVTVVGGLQTVVSLPFLTPINPQLGTVHPSLMGYKNPAALALLGQIFLLVGLALEGGRKSSHRLAWGLLLLVELIYLASLRSRTAYAALLVAGLFLITLWLSRKPSGMQLRRFASAVVVLVLVAAVWAGLHGPTRERVFSLASYAADPGAYLESDRGTYLRNTLVMARHYPFGVGLGDWQTHYPVFRTYNRTVSFTDNHQVRRAHSDHVQVLGEGGFPGLFLWLLFLCILIVGTARHYRRTGRITSLCAAAQLVAFTVAMATDYLVEMPYGKLQFFLVVFLALAWAAPDEASDAPPSAQSPIVGRILLVGVLVVASAQVLYHVELARKVHAAAGLQRTYFEALKSPELRPRVLEKGRAFAGRLGYTKTFHKDYLILGHSAHLVGQDAPALAATRKALELHPYSTHAFRLMATLSPDPDRAVLWREAYQHVMHEATHGFEWVYP